MPPTRNSRTTRRTRQRRPNPATSQIPRLATSTAELGRSVVPHVQNDSHVVAFARNYLAGTFASSLAGDAMGALSMSVSSLPNSSEFTNLFDQYRIVRLEYTFWPFQTQSTISTTATPVIASVVDYDDAVTPGGFGALQQYENCMVHSPYKPFTVSFKPHVALAAYSGGFTSYANQKDQWIDSSSNAVQHYGCKFATPQSFGTIQTWYIIGRALVECKNVR
jgi:hypothetical protein